MKQFVSRWMTQQLRTALRAMPVVVVTGARQTGKTTLDINAEQDASERASRNVSLRAFLPAMVLKQLSRRGAVAFEAWNSQPALRSPR